MKNNLLLFLILVVIVFHQYQINQCVKRTDLIEASRSLNLNEQPLKHPKESQRFYLLKSHIIIRLQSRVIMFSHILKNP